MYGNFCEPGRDHFVEKAKTISFRKISISGCQQNVFYSIFSQIRTHFEPVQEPCTMNVRNELLHDMACVVKCETPPELRWKLCEFQHGKRICFGINLIGLMMMIAFIITLGEIM